MAKIERREDSQFAKARWLLEVSDQELDTILESLNNSASEDLEAAHRGEDEERDEWESSAARKLRLAKRMEER